MSVRRTSLTTTLGRNPTSASTTAAAAAPATTTEPNSERSAVVLALFGPSVGPCVGDFSTTYNRVNGRLYASTKAILFYSNLFGFERRLCLQLNDVEIIEAYRSTSIRILMVDCEDYIFRKFANRDSVLNLLQQLLHQHDYPDGEDEGEDPNSPQKVMTQQLRSLTPSEEMEASDEEFETGPLRPHFNSECIDSLDRPQELAPPPQSPASTKRGRGGRRNRPRGRARSVPPPKRIKKKSQSAPILQRSNTTVVPTPTPRMRRNSDLDTSGTSLDKLEGSEHTDPLSSPNSFDMQSAWGPAKEPYEEIALETIRLSCTLDRFESMFVLDDAKFPILQYMTQQIGDKNLKVSMWKQTNPGEFPTVLERSINFIHPLKNPVGPSEAKTCRTQTFRRFGDVGMTIQNSTVIEGVPAADCFRVEDRWIIEKTSDSTLTMLVSFRLNFVKRTMFKPVIQKNTRQETRNWFRGFAKYIQAALAGDDVGRVAKETVKAAPEIIAPIPTQPAATTVPTSVLPPSPIHASATPSALDNMFKVGALLLLFILACQVMFIQNSLLSMQSQMVEMQTQNSQLIATLIELQTACMERLDRDKT